VRRPFATRFTADQCSLRMAFVSSLRLSSVAMHLSKTAPLSVISPGSGSDCPAISSAGPDAAGAARRAGLRAAAAAGGGANEERREYLADYATHMQPGNRWALDALNLYM
jgi:hypothetical protein